MCTCVPNMKFLHLTICQGEVCTTTTPMLMQDDANDDDGQFMIILGSLADKPNEPKTYGSRGLFTMNAGECFFIDDYN